MTPAALEVARRLAAHPRWEWRAGMRIVSRLDGAFLWRRAEGDSAIHPDWGTEPVPDLDDPATAGVVLGMLGEELGRWPVALLALVDEDMEAAVMQGGALRGDLPTLGEAAGRALLAVWGEP